MKGTLTRHRHVIRMLISLLTTLPMLALASNTAMLTVKVTVFVAPCVINNNNPIEVEFDDVMTTRVDGKNSRKQIIFALECKGAQSSAMKLKVKGPGASFDGTLLQVRENSSLGIELQNGATKFPVNTWLNFTYPNKPELWAVPVKKNGATLRGGEFTAGATMAVDYQ